jgi:glycosyltransferase involved in cell wall biosynthesis
MKVLFICNYKPGVGGISGQVEILQRMLWKDGHKTDIFSTKASVLRRFLLPLQLRLEAKNYDLLHIHCCSGWGFLPAVVGITVGRRLKKRIVLTYHGGGGEKFFANHTKLVKHYLTRTDANIVLSGFLGEVFKHYGIPYTTIPNIIELDATQYRERSSITPKYICVRAHEKIYNIPCIFRAFQQVQSVLPEATLTLIGDGSQHKALIQIANRMHLHNVTFTGRVDNTEIYHYLDKADVMLSTPTVDNMPVSLLEAMNAGLLVISTKVGGVPYMINNGNTGLLIPSNDSKALAERMIWATKNATIAQAIIQQAHQAVSKYQWEGIKDSLYSIYGIPS